jgi:hypothetical protein
MGICNSCKKGELFETSNIIRCNYCLREFAALQTKKIKNWKDYTPAERKAIIYYGGIDE